MDNRQPSFNEFAVIVGVDTHRDTHTAVLTDAVGRQRDCLVVLTRDPGYRQLIDWALTAAAGAPVLWAIEGSRSHGAGLTRILQAAGAQITEADRPTRRARRHGKSDPIDALLAARAAITREEVREPHSDGARDCARLLLAERDRLVRQRTAVINQMRDLVMAAPDELRQRLRGRTITGLLAASSALRARQNDDIETSVRVQSLRRLGRWHTPSPATRQPSRRTSLVDEPTRPTHDEPNRYRCHRRSTTLGQLVTPRPVQFESAFAALAGASPLSASSGQKTRHRLNRGGDRHLNRALHQIMITRLAIDPATQDYVNHRISEGKTAREAPRCVKRCLAVLLGEVG